MSPQGARMIDDMILAGLARGTRKIYIQAVRRLAAHYHRSPDLLNEEKVRSYLLGLRQRGVARGAPSGPVITACASSINTRSAVPGSCSGGKRIASPREKRLPDALSEDQVRHLLSGIRNPTHKTCLAVMYACGLRIREATMLEIGAIDRANQVLRIVRGWHDDVQISVRTVPDPHIWGLTIHRPLPRWSVGHAALLGDACHSNPPFLGQGAIMAV